MLSYLKDSSPHSQTGAVRRVYVSLGMDKQLRKMVRATCAESCLRWGLVSVKFLSLERMTPGTPSAKMGAPRRVKSDLTNRFTPGTAASTRMRVSLGSCPEHGNSSHFCVFKHSPKLLRPCFRVSMSAKTTSGLPPKVPSSRYHTLRGERK
ncbi:hypothetical protein JYU34_013681 [Plutella xylostella]|uniref:Uncharacterized protein n=1 Tax=Plutella xylostella TaxID=51655 RepID=A0ABQ7QBP6_PLUXY|nr:hypothetical protein JYU34_013681 [Plutella xylostella]